MSETLKPCPFCGGEAELQQRGDARQSTIIRCEDCGCALESGETLNHGTAWNTRADDTRWRSVAEQAEHALKEISKRGANPITEFGYGAKRPWTRLADDVWRISSEALSAFDSLRKEARDG